ncbi:hypothetical protein FDUTEX481_02149 [Tolypothrix sp. PCC 7601]|nr:hypothetical protein FDUTEX481_02149 [Tolypothrix sp. PCC 7601]
MFLTAHLEKCRQYRENPSTSKTNNTSLLTLNTAVIIEIINTPCLLSLGEIVV